MQQVPSMTATTDVPQAAMTSSIYTAPVNSGKLELNRSLVSLLDEACQTYPNATAFNERQGDNWFTLSNQAYKNYAETFALALNDLGLQPGDRVAFFTHSDLSFCLADMACLIAGLIGVPIYLTHTPKAMSYILTQTKARALIVSDEHLLEDIKDALAEAPDVKHIIMRHAPSHPLALSDTHTLHTFDALSERGKSLHQTNNTLIQTLKARIKAQDTATIIYTSGTTGLPKGVILSHENLSSNAIASMTGLTTFQKGDKETALTFLPLTHIFARTLYYALMWYGTSIYYSQPDTLSGDLKEIKPTFFASVPRVLEKAYERILATGASLPGVKKMLFDWALDTAKKYDVEHPPTGLYALQLSMAQKLVLSKWREALGGNIKTIIVGGAALRADLVNIFAAANIEILQGYGLTETSPVITFNRPGKNKAGTVGTPLAGVEITISPEKEILTRGPHIMQGYYQNEDATRQVIDENNWFHTGDMGEITPDGYLKITGRIKNLFKLSTGKYVMPQPLEDKLESEALIDAALVIGEGEKFCTAMLFLNPEVLTTYATDLDEALRSEALQARVTRILKQANAELPHWSNIKKALLLRDVLTTENGLLTPKLSVKRFKVITKYQEAINVMYQPDTTLKTGVIIDVT